MSQFLYILLGLTLVTVTNLSITLAFIYFYFRVAEISESLKYKFKLAGMLSATNILLQMISLILFSYSGALVYCLVSFSLSVIGYFGIMKYSYKFHLLENAIIAVSLSIILNPVWLTLFGII